MFRFGLNLPLQLPLQEDDWKMKTRLLMIFGASVVGFVIILLALTILSDDSKSIQLTHEQVCAYLFDLNMNNFSNHVGEQEETGMEVSSSHANDLVFHSEFFKEWRNYDYDCIDTVNDWEDISEYKNFIKEVVNWDEVT